MIRDTETVLLLADVVDDARSAEEWELAARAAMVLIRSGARAEDRFGKDRARYDTADELAKRLGHRRLEASALVALLDTGSPHDDVVRVRAMVALAEEAVVVADEVERQSDLAAKARVSLTHLGHTKEATATWRRLASRAPFRATWPH